MAFIYKITNQVNQKTYIGKTTTTINRRWNQHKSELAKDRDVNRPLYKAMRKYGIENFTIEIVEECSVDILSEREIYWIEQYNSFHDGYNATLGGDGKSYLDYKIVIDLWNQGLNCRQIHDKTSYSNDTITKVLDEANISRELRKARGHSSITKGVEMINKNTNQVIKTFSSIKDAYIFLNKQHSGHIADVCNGKRKSAYGYKWKYKTLEE